MQITAYDELRRLIKTPRHILFSIILLALSSSGLSQTVSFKGNKALLETVFAAIETQTGYTVFYNSGLLAKAAKVTVNIKNIPLTEALDLIFNNQPFTYSIVGKLITIESRQQKVNQNMMKDSLVQGIHGKVMAAKTNTPLEGVSIVEKGSVNGAMTDRDGNFQLGGIYTKVKLVFSYIGYKTQEVLVSPKGVTVIKLEPQEANLDNVVISTGYQKIEQKYLTGAVTTLKMDSIRQPGLTTVDKMLEGRVPGLVYMQNSGQAGAAPKLRIRGTSTLLGSQEPLWVVDGIVQTDPVPIPAEKINNLDFVNLVGNSISGLNPNDIEQIDVLKDAAATALYGVRAANGVIVVTTKRGKPGPPAINYSVSGLYTRRPRYTDQGVYMMNSQERVDVSREMIEKQFPFSGASLESYEKAITDYYGGLIGYDTYKRQIDRAETLNTDWLGVATRDQFSANHTLGISGGNQTNRYYVSLGYTDEKGVIRGESNKRYTGQLKFDMNYKKFKAQFGMMAHRNDRQYTPEELGILNYAYGTSRAIPLYNEDGSLYYYSTANSNKIRSFNILNEMNRSGRTTDENTYQATASLNYQLIPGLQLNADLNYTVSNTEQRTWFEEKTNWIITRRGVLNPDGNFNPLYDELPFGGQLTRQSIKQTDYTTRGQLNFSRYIDAGKKHQVNAVLGGEISSTKNDQIGETQRGYYPDRGYSFANIDLNAYPAYARWLSFDGRPTIEQGVSNLASAYIATTYIYNDRYIVSANTRSDYSNVFGSRSNERFLPTWSLSGRWNMHNDLFKNASWVNQMALIFSYGTQGNILLNQTPYAIISKGSISSSYRAFGSYILAYPNPNLKWEKTDSYNAGFMFSLFDNRLNGSVNYFYKRTTDAFLSKRVSIVNGYSNYTVNAGVLENQGVELSFNFTPINNVGVNNNKRGFVWRIDPQLGQVFNTLLANTINRNGQNILIDPGSVTYQDFLDGTVPVNGKSINTFYAYRFEGLDHTGEPLFFGAEPGNATALTAKYKNMSREDIYNAVLVEAGRREPVVQGGVSNYFGYRSWSIDFTFTYSLGNKIRLLKIASGEYGTYQPNSQQNLRGEFVNRWRYPGDELHTDIPGIRPGGYTNFPWWLSYEYANLGLPNLGENYYQLYDNADVRIVSGSYVKLQNVNLRYNCSQDLCTRLGIKAATFNLSGTNLFTLADKALRGQDPTQSGSSVNISLSIRPVYSFSINLSL